MAIDSNQGIHLNALLGLIWTKNLRMHINSFDLTEISFSPKESREWVNFYLIQNEISLSNRIISVSCSSYQNSDCFEFDGHFLILTWTSLLIHCLEFWRKFGCGIRNFTKYVNRMAADVSVIEKNLWESWMPIKFVWIS